MTEKQLQGERLEILIDALNLNQSTFSKRVNVAQSYINRIISGQKSLSHKVITNITNGFSHVNMNWLINGAGEMFLPTSDPAETSVANEPAAKYEKRGEEEPFELLRLKMESFDARIKELEAEIKRMKEEK